MAKHPKSKGGRPRRRRPPEAIIKVVRRNIPSALDNPATLALVRMLAYGDDLIVAEEMYRYLRAKAKREGRRVEREAFIGRIADTLNMDRAKLRNFLSRSKSVR
jgi:hypothetical protein